VTFPIEVRLAHPVAREVGGAESAIETALVHRRATLADFVAFQAEPTDPDRDRLAVIRLCDLAPEVVDLMDGEDLDAIVEAITREAMCLEPPTAPPDDGSISLRHPIRVAGRDMPTLMIRRRETVRDRTRLGDRTGWSLLLGQVALLADISEQAAGRIDCEDIPAVIGGLGPFVAPGRIALAISPSPSPRSSTTAPST
jgi:hypothetical protein